MSSPVQAAKSISAVVNNTLLALWISGQKEAAKAKLQFAEDQSTYGKMVKQQGFTLFRIVSSNAILKDQFPENMLFILPSGIFKETAKLVGLARKEALANLEALEKTIQVSKDTGWSPDLRETGVDVPGIPSAHDPMNWRN